MKNKVKQIIIMPVVQQILEVSILAVFKVKLNNSKNFDEF